MPRHPSRHLEKLNPAKLRVLYSIVFLMAVASALTAYVQSPYLSLYVKPGYLGLIFSFANILVLIAVNKLPLILRRLGGWRVFCWLALGVIATQMSLAWFPWRWPVIVSFIFFAIFLFLIWVVADIFIEEYSADRVTGRIRGFALTIMNLGWVVTPFLTGMLVDKFSYGFLFAVGALVLSPTLLIFSAAFRPSMTLTTIKLTPLLSLLKVVRGRLELKRIFTIAFYLHFFYSWMVIYLPLLLLSREISWPNIGLIFSVMLLPFVLFQYPAGRLADKYLNEKQILTFGFVVAGLATLAIYFINTNNIFILMLVLFLTRVGASLIEVMRDSYFFKKIDKRDAALIGLFRSVQPAAYIISPIIASFLLIKFSLPFIFLGL